MSALSVALPVVASTCRVDSKQGRAVTRLSKASPLPIHPFLVTARTHISRRKHGRKPTSPLRATVSAPHLFSVQNTDGVKALLDKLKTSTAWKQAIAASDPPVSTPHESHGNPNSDVRPSVASLLAQLAGASAIPEYSALPPPTVADIDDSRPNEPVAPAASPAPGVAPPSSIGSGKHDLHAFPFQQSLSHLAHLSTNPGFIESIRRVRYFTGGGPITCITTDSLEIRFRSNRAPSNPNCGMSGSPFNKSTRKRSKLP